MVEIVGAVHVHSTCSDGTRTVDELVAVAAQVGLQYIVINDHMTLEGRKCLGTRGFPEVTALVGYEHNDHTNRNHYLVLGSQRVYSELQSACEYVGALRKDGGVGFIAHPCEKRHSFSSLPPYPWTDWEVCGFDGIEIWNQMSDWAEHLKPVLGLLRIVHPRRLLAGPPPEALARWDQLNTQRFVSALGGVDAHSHRIHVGPLSLEVFPAKVEFKGVRTHLYVPPDYTSRGYEQACVAIISSLRDGHGFISNLRWGDARGSLFMYEAPNGALCGCGVPPCVVEPGGVLRVTLPEKGEIRLLRNGCPVMRVFAGSNDFAITNPGAYRLEVRRKNRPWIFTNPFPIGEYPFQT